MLFSRRSATSACAIVLIVMAVTPYHRFSSSIGLASGAMTWLVILGACLAAFGHGVALRKGREIRRPGRLGVFGVFLAAIAAAPVWVVLLNMVQDLTVFEPLFLASLLGQSSAVNVVVATVIVCWSVPMLVTHIALARSVEDEKAVLEYRANGSTEAAHVRRLALLTSRALSDVQARILLMTAEGTTTKTIAQDVGYAASTVQALRSASYRQLKIKNKAKLISLLSQVDNV